MTASDPYGKQGNQSNHPENTSACLQASGGGGDHRFGRVKYREPAPPSFQFGGNGTALDDTRTNLRAKNYHGTLGAFLNFDGSVSDKPIPRMNNNQQPEGSDESIFTGGHTREIRGPVRYGPGIQSSMYSDSAQNQERKRALQQELAEYEKIQLKEREAKRQADRRHEIESGKILSWPFESHKQLTVVPEMEEYSKDLASGEPERRYHHHSHDPPAPSPRQLNYPNRQDAQNKAESQHFNPISHAPVSSKQAVDSRRRKIQIDDERAAVYPLGIKVPDTSQKKTHQPPCPQEQISFNPVNRYTTEYSTHNTSDGFGGAGGPSFGRRKVLEVADAEERSKYEIQARRLLQIQEEELKRRKESQIFSQMREIEIGKQSVASRGKESQILKTFIQQQEPMDRSKAMQYHADLDRLMEQKQALERRERERRRNEGDGMGFWDKFGGH
ncbi:hypothetical protein HDU67_000592 [Dinochytrium kinnereticum]|nr:hypothetical protein HDU67_000592 [Dinochytrium kinnereticum]